jgi:hypothetical protein
MASSQELAELFRAMEHNLEELLKSNKAIQAVILSNQVVGPPRSRRPSSLDVDPSAIRSILNRASTLHSDASPPLRAINFAEPVPKASASLTIASDILMSGTARRPRRLTNESDSLRPIDPVHRPISVSEMELDDDDEDGLSQRSRFIQLTSPTGVEIVERNPIYVKAPLRQFSYEMEHLLDHLINIDQKLKDPKHKAALSVAFDELYSRRSGLTMQELHSYMTKDDHPLYQQGSYEIYNIGRNGKITDLARRPGESDDDADELSVANTWAKLSVSYFIHKIYHRMCRAHSTLQVVNPKQKSSGRMT